MSRRDAKMAYIRAVDTYVKADAIRKKRLKICDTLLKIAAGAMMIAALYVVHGS